VGGCYLPDPTAGDIMTAVTVRWKASDLPFLKNPSSTAIAQRNASTTSTTSSTLNYTPVPHTPISIPASLSTETAKSGGLDPSPPSSSSSVHVRIGGIIAAVLVVLILSAGVLCRHQKQKKAKLNQANAAFQLPGSGPPMVAAAKWVDVQTSTADRNATAPIAGRNVAYTESVVTANEKVPQQMTQTVAPEVAEVPVTQLETTAPAQRHINEHQGQPYEDGLEVAHDQATRGVPESGLEVVQPSVARERASLHASLDQLQENRQRIMALNAIDEEEARIRRRLEELDNLQ
jgi:hypothetical protein